MGPMAREISAGGVVLREINGIWHVALIEAQHVAQIEGQKKKSEPAKTMRRRRLGVLSLPKGLVDSGEKAKEAAIREVREETGVRAEVLTKLADIKYVYVRNWGDGERVFKVVSFYLMRYLSGEIDELTSDMRIEVKRALWVPIKNAAQRMAYSSERKVVGKAEEYLLKKALEPTNAAPAAEEEGLRSHTDR
jgi:8-oxo-dGTP pyrophosphatase MutT (NUDIX family)